MRSPREALGVQGMPITVDGRFSSLVEAGDEDVDTGQLPSSNSSSATEAKNPGPHRQRRRVRSESSDFGCPGVVGGAVHRDLTLIDSSDDPNSLCQQHPVRDHHAGWFWSHGQWMPLHNRSKTVTGSQRMPQDLDALEEDLELRSRRLLLVSGSQGQGATIETDFPSEIQSEVVDMINEDSDADEEVAPSRSHGEDVDSEARSRVGATTDMSDTDSLADNAASEVSVDDIRVPSVEPDMEVRDPQVNSLEIREAFTLDAVDLTNVFSLRASVMKTVPRFLRGPFRND